MDLVVQEPGQWVEDGTIDLGEGASASLQRGIAFPVSDGTEVVGVVLVGPLTVTLPTGEAEQPLRLTLPEPPQITDGRWTVQGEVLLALGKDPDLVAGAALGKTLLGDRDTVSYLENGNEVVLVTGIRPRQALDDARDALRRRSILLTEIGLDPVNMLTREQWRSGEPRSIVELRTPTDLRPLVAAADAQADIVRPWLTWVVDPTGLVDDTLAGVLGVHGPVDGGRVWRAVGGTPMDGAPAWRAVRGVANLTIERDTGVTHEGSVSVILTVEAGETGRLVDVWVPEVNEALVAGVVTTRRKLDVVASRPDSSTFPTVDVPFGVRTVPGATLHSWLLPAAIESGTRSNLRLDWSEAWDIGGQFDPSAFRDWAYGGPLEDNPPSLSGTVSLGKLAAGVQVFPALSTGPAAYPCELRAGTNIAGWSVVVAPGAEPGAQDNGTVWVWRGPAATPVAIGRFEEFVSPARPGLPKIRIERHTTISDELLVSIRGVLNFYDDAFGPWPYPELVVVQGRNRPVLLAKDPSDVRPAASPLLVTAGFRYLGGGELEYARLLTIGFVEQNHYLDPVPSPVTKKGREGMRGRSGHATRSLALTVAEGFWGPVAFSNRDIWLAGAIPRLYRDRFVEEAWGEKLANGWVAHTDEVLAMTEPSPKVLSLVGRSEPWAAERGARLLELVLARLGEDVTLQALEKVRTGSADQHDLDGLLDRFEADGGVSFRGLFDLFAVVGVRPEVRAELGADGFLTVTTDPPLGTYELPVEVNGTLRWIPMVDGVGRLDLAGDTKFVLDPNRWLPLRGVDRASEPPKRTKRKRKQQPPPE